MMIVQSSHSRSFSLNRWMSSLMPSQSRSWSNSWSSTRCERSTLPFKCGVRPDVHVTNVEALDVPVELRLELRAVVPFGR